MSPNSIPRYNQNVGIGVVWELKKKLGVCMYVCVCVYTCVGGSVLKKKLGYVCVCVYTFVGVSVCMGACCDVKMILCMGVCVFVCMHVCVCLCVCVYA